MGLWSTVWKTSPLKKSGMREPEDVVMAVDGVSVVCERSLDVIDDSSLIGSWDGFRLKSSLRRSSASSLRLNGEVRCSDEWSR